MKNCPICQNKLKKEKNKSIIVKYKTSNGVKDILVKNLSYSYCANCNEIFYNNDEIKNYELQLEKALEEERRKEGLLTAKEIKNIRNQYGLSQFQLEKLLDIGPKNVAKWETYRSNQSKNIDRILRIMEKDICFFVKLLHQVDYNEFKNVFEKNSLYVNNYVIFEFLSTIYPDLNYKNITADLINNIGKIIKETITNKLEYTNNTQLTYKEAI